MPSYMIYGMGELGRMSNLTLGTDMEELTEKLHVARGKLSLDEQLPIIDRLKYMQHPQWQKMLKEIVDLLENKVIIPKNEYEEIKQLREQLNAKESMINRLIKKTRKD